MVTRCHRFHQVVVTVLLTTFLTTASCSLHFGEHDSSSRHPHLQVDSGVALHEAENEETDSMVWYSKVFDRQSRSDDFYDASGNSSADDTDVVGENCTSLNHPLTGYNNSCQFVNAECARHTRLINYLAFVLCDLRNVKPLAYIILALWLAYLISLLATTVDYFFVPPLTFLAEKLNLTPSIAGITLLALGNAAPDMFVLYSGLVQDDLALVLGSLIGGGIFITTVVLGTVILVTTVRPVNVDKIDFMRDILAFMVVASTVVVVAFDGTVYLIEACLFPLIYFGYIGIAVGMSYMRDWLKKRSQGDVDEEVMWNEEVPDKSTSLDRSLTIRQIARLLKEEANPHSGDDSLKLRLEGLTWPSRSHIVLKFLWIIQWPFSLLRWMSVPSFGHDGNWGKWQFFFTVTSPIPMSLLMLTAVKGWSGFTLFVGELPLLVLLVIIGAVLSVMLFFLLTPKKPPHWTMNLVLVPAAFAMAIVWLYVEASEVVSVLKAFGLLLNISTAILGLTILAIGNSMADWVADTVVARCGKPEMAFSSCFGSPLMSSVIGLSMALIIKITIYNHGEPFKFHIHTSEYSQVKLAWIFLGISLVGSAVFFPIFRFSPPRPYGAVLIFVYLTFVLFVVLGETSIIPVNL